jgi:hypothetical protein
MESRKALSIVLTKVPERPSVIESLLDELIPTRKCGSDQIQGLIFAAHGSALTRTHACRAKVSARLEL